MGAEVVRGFVFLILCVLSCSGTLVEERLFSHTRKQLLGHEVESADASPQFDVVTPMTTVPVVNPTYPSTTTPRVNPTYPSTPTPVVNPVATPATDTSGPTITTPTTTPTITTPASSGGQSWCIASQSAPQTALQVALDYACGYGGADCSAIQVGGSCYDPNSVRDHASYAFNDYYQKNPIPNSCNFGGTAVITNIDPSNGGCHYQSTSTSSSVLNTTNPTGATVFGAEPTGGSSNVALVSKTLPLFNLAWFVASVLAVNYL